MIEMQCPACGADGRVPNAKVNTRLVCRKCLKVFHLTPSGRAVLGNPSAASASLPRQSYEPDPTVEVDQWFEKLGQRLTSPRTIITAASLLLLAIVVAFMSTRKTETLEERVDKVARAAVAGDLQTIRSMAASGTEADTERWYDAVRARCDELRQRAGSHQLSVELSIKPEESGPESSDVVARVALDENLERRGAAIPDPTLTLTLNTGSMILPMSWKSEGWSGWRLDGKRSLELAGTTP